MTYENVDKDPDLRKSSDLGLSKISTGVKAIVATVCMAIFFVTFLLGRYWSPTWGPSQWGPAATWFGGILTAVAVTVSLVQAYTARKDAAADKIAASERLAEEKARHDAQLERAEGRLTRQLETDRRLEQLRTIPPIWEQIRLLGGPAMDVVKAVSALNALAAKKMEHQEKLTESDAADLLEKINAWAFAYSSVQTVFSTALMLVDEPNVERQLAALHLRLHKLHNAALFATHWSFRSNFPETKPILDALQSVRELRDPMVNAVRIHLGKAQPFRYAYEEESTDDLYFTLPNLDRN